MAYGTMSIGNAGFTKKFISTLFLLMHPVGTPYISEDPTSPAEKYGGTWERIEGKFIMGASDDYPAGSTGGSATHTQAEQEVAPHMHIQQMCVGKNNGSNFCGAKEGSYIVYSSEGASFLDMGYTRNISSSVQPMDILNPYYAMYIWRRVA